MDTTASDTLIRTHLDFLRRHAPFDRMEPEALRFLGERMSTGFYPAESEILVPEDGPPRFFYIVYRGKVQARQAGAVSVTEYSTLTLGPGEGFPIGAISAGRPSTNSHVAVEDTYCFQLPAADFLRLQELSPSFQIFCTRYIASLMSQSREQLQAHFSQRAAEQQTMTTSLANLVKKAPVYVSPTLPTRAALEKMAEASVGCMAVADDDGKPVGVLTQSDILKRIVLTGYDLARPIAEVMTTPPHTLSGSATAYDAALEMATHGVRHILVVDSEDRLKGVVSERDLFALQRIGLRQIRSGIESAADIEALQRASRDIRQLALNLLAQGIAMRFGATGRDWLTPALAIGVVVLICYFYFVDQSLVMRIYVQNFGYGIIEMGSTAFLAGSLGRTMSPVAGAAIVCAGLARISPIEITKRNGPGCIVAAIAVMVILL